MIYFIQQGDGGPIKIGHVTSDAFFQSRLSSIQVGSPWELNVLGVMNGTRKNEAAIHADFFDWRIRGEWFHPCVKLRAFIAIHARELSVKAPPEPLAKRENSRPARYMLRLDRSLMNRVRQVAEDNRRSINSQLCIIVAGWAESQSAKG